MAETLDDRFEKTVAWLVELKQQYKSMQNLHNQAIKIFIALVKLQDERIDQVMQQHGIVLHENGVQIFPRPKKNFPQVIFKTEDKN